MRRRFRLRLNYSNVMATVAVFIALGGGAYAAVALPPGSVGPKQLRPRAVGVGNLSFPLGVAGLTDKQTQDLARAPCTEPPPDQKLHVECPVPALTGLSSNDEVHLALTGRSHLLISVVAGIAYRRGPTTAEASVTCYVFIDGKRISTAAQDIKGGTELQLPVSDFTTASAGHHTVGVGFEATYDTRSAGDVLVAPVTLTVTSLP
jgi:hypothetical protein